MTTYVVIKTVASQKTCKVAGKSTKIETPKTPVKAPTTGLVWPS